MDSCTMNSSDALDLAVEFFTCVCVCVLILKKCHSFFLIILK